MKTAKLASQSPSQLEPKEGLVAQARPPTKSASKVPSRVVVSSHRFAD
jgi:hypothetical protein